MNLSLETVLRCLDLLPLVRENQGISLDDLAQRTGIPARVIADELVPTLMLCGAPPYMPHDYVSIFIEGDSVFVSFADQFKRPVTLLPIEVVALHLALASLCFPGDHEAEVLRRVEDLRKKIELALPREQRIFLEESHRISIDEGRDRSSPLHLSLKKAIKERRKMRVDYLSWGDATTKSRVIHPLGLVTKDGVAYVVAFDSLRQHEISLRVDRIQAAETLADRFQPAAGFSLQKRIEEGLFNSPDADETEVVVRLVGKAARLASETLDQRQWRWEKGDELVLRLPTSRPLSVVRWIFSFGPEAVIEGPPEVRALAVQELERLQSTMEAG